MGIGEQVLNEKVNGLYAFQKGARSGKSCTWLHEVPIQATAITGDIMLAEMSTHSPLSRKVTLRLSGLLNAWSRAVFGGIRSVGSVSITVDGLWDPA